MADTFASPDNAGEGKSGDDELLRRLKSWFRADSEHSSDWRKEAKEDYDFTASNQWSEADKNQLREQMRPAITFDRCGPIVRSVKGEQINNRMETQYLPREMGDVRTTEHWGEAARYFRDQCDADMEESDAFGDTVVCGMGWTDTRLDMDEDPDEPMVAVERIDPFEMYWDADSRKRNLADARRIWRVRDIPITMAREMFPKFADADLDASWASNVAAEGEKANDNNKGDEYQGENQDDPARKDDDALVTIVQVQWRASETYYKIEIPQPPQMDPMGQPMPVPPAVEEASEEDYRKNRKRLEAIGAKVAKLERKGFKKAFIGKTILKQGPLKCPHFTFNCITGFRDRNKGTWYGLVRPMKDPQRWANKWLSQTLHIMNSTAKGGVMMEKGAVEDQREFETSFAKPDAVTYVPDGTLSPLGGGPAKIQPKPVGTFPAGFYQLMQFAISSVRDVTGVNLEMLGMREADQPASLEWQRRQAGITILAELFEAMRRYHRMQGRVMLYFIQNYLSDGRLIRIVGEDGAKYVPLVKQADAKFDVVVDEGPTSPNQKERIWSMIGERIWELPPAIQMALIKYSPLPASVVEDLKAAAEQASQSPAAQLAQKMQEMEVRLTQAEAQLKTAQAGKAQAETQATLAEIGQPTGSPIDPMASQAEMAKANADNQAKNLKTQADFQLGRERIAADIQINREKIGASERQGQRDAAQREREGVRSAFMAERQGARQASTAEKVAKQRASRPNGSKS